MCTKTSVESIISMQTSLIFLTMMKNHDFRHWEPEKSLSGVNPETNEEVIIQFRIVERDLATLIDLNDYETLRPIKVSRRSRTYCCSRAMQLNPLTASELCQHHSP